MPINYQANPVQWSNARQQTVAGAMGRITRMLTGASLSASAVTRDAQADALYQQHFVDPGHVQLGAVQQVIQRMLARVTTGTLNFHYVPTLAAFQGLGVGALPAGVVIGNVEAFVIQRGIGAGVALSCYFAPAFFTGNVHVAANPNVRTGTGTFLHEMSHGDGNTQDHAYTWQAGYGALTAAQRADNADSYRAYCQTFDVINAAVVNAPPPAAPAAPVPCPQAGCNLQFRTNVLLQAHRVQTGH